MSPIVASASSTSAAAAAAAAAPMTARRQSCDRCHGQKLRCVRDAGSDIGACMRCLRQGAQCVYSLSLPKGRPSLSRWASVNSNNNNNNNSNNSDAATTRGAASGGNDNGSAGTVARAGSRAGSMSSSAAAAAAASVVPDSSSSTHSGSDDASTHISAETTLTHPDSRLCDEGTILSEALNSPSSSAFVASWLGPSDWPEPQATAVLGGHGQQPQHQQGQPPDLTGLHTLIEHPVDTCSGRLHGGGADGHHQYSPVGGGMQETGSSASAYFNMPSPERDEQQVPETGISQLSQLSIRLCQLYRSTETLHETVTMSNRLNAGSNSNNNSISTNTHHHHHHHHNHLHRLGSGPRLVDDAVFKLVTAWLVDASADVKFPTTIEYPSPPPDTDMLGAVLCGVFSASGDLLEILRNLHASAEQQKQKQQHQQLWGGVLPTSSSLHSMGFGGDPAGAASATTNTAATDATSTASATSGAHRMQTHGSSHSHTSRVASNSPHSNAAISHLLIACHTQLLSIYDFVLMALQRDADLWGNPCLSPGGLEADSSAFGGSSNALSDIRLIMVVQLCSCLVNRQNQSVGHYLSSQLPSASHSEPFDPAGAQHSSQQLSIDTSRRFISRLMMDVQQRISRLLQTLRV